MTRSLRWTHAAGALALAGMGTPVALQAGCCVVEPEAALTADLFDAENAIALPLPVEEAPTGPDAPIAVAGAAASDAATAAVVAGLDQAFGFCSAIVAREYIVDCLGAELRRLSDALPESGDYAPVQDALYEAWRGLDAIVEANPSPDRPPAVARSTGPGGRTSTRPLRPVATPAVETALAQAVAVIEEAETVLLRSTGSGSASRDLALTSVAASLDGGTVLLRST